MAEIAVSFTLEKLLPLVRDEANLLRNISIEFEEIQKELESIQALLKDADKKAAAERDNTKEGVKTWVKQLREASFRIEDVIDECMILVEQQPYDPRCPALLCQTIHFIETLMPRNRIASEIQQIKSSVHEINRRSKDYHFQELPSLEQGQSSNRGSQSVWPDPRMRSRNLDEAELVDIEGPRNEMIGWLKTESESLIVISVVGMGGIGKTTLVSSVYKDQEVSACFDSHAWITVSQSYTMEKLMIDLLEKFYQEEKKELPTRISKMGLESLIEEVRNYLKPKRYVVIFDDVWNENFGQWIENPMLDNKKGSRIIITTRRIDIAYTCSYSPHFNAVCELKTWSSENSMKLFCKKAFQSDYSGCYPDHLKNISSAIDDKCRGLPLAIALIGALLSRKKHSEWDTILENLSSEMQKNPQLSGIPRILGFSYDDLPYHLKMCLLYFGIYPENYEVRSKRLIRQWIAEGFVKDEEGKTLEDTAQQYLEELINRNLVQVSSFTIDGKAKSCRIHSLLYKLILIKSKDLSFCQHISKQDESTSSRMIRRLSIATISKDLMSAESESPHTRSLFVFAAEKSTLTDSFVQRIPTKYKLLKVLDFEYVQLHSVPKTWGNLAHLKYLSLRHSGNLTESLLKFIGKLQNLETLDIRDTNVREMPKEICKLRKLRHLLGNNLKLFQLKNSLGSMTSLQTLSEVRLIMDDNEAQVIVDDDGVELIKELGKLKHLKKLGLAGVKGEQGRFLCSSISVMQHLEKLHIQSSTLEDEVIDLHAISSLPMLLKLSLVGKLNRFPEWVPGLQHLVKLSLQFSNLSDDPLISLQNMSQLLYLEITNDFYRGERLCFQHGGFQQLKELYLRDLSHLNSIIIEDGALHSLETLHIWKIPFLKKEPLGIRYLKKLEVLDIHDMSTEFNQSIAPEGGPEPSPCIRHVPLVRISNSESTDGTIKTRIIHHSKHSDS